MNLSTIIKIVATLILIFIISRANSVTLSLDDYTVEDNKDKEYNKDTFSGLGKVYLPKNIMNGKNVLTQNMIAKPNTIYIIQYDYDLRSAKITIPEGCVLDFQGGSFNNGIIVGNDGKIKADSRNVIFHNVDVNKLLNAKYYHFDDFSKSNVIEACLYKQSCVDFEGNTFVLDNPIFIENNIEIRNGTFISATETSMFNFNVNNVGTDSVILKNITVNGNNLSYTGANIFYIKNVQIENCHFCNFKELDSGARGALFRRCENVNVINTTINGIEAFPNGVVGDEKGGCRAITLQHSKNVLIKGCTFYDIISTEDGDAIHLVTDYNLFTNEIDGEIIYPKIIESCYFYNISRSAVKMQDKGVIIRNNIMANDKASADAIIRIYANNCIVENNKVDYKSAYFVIIGMDKKLLVKNIVVRNNIIKTPGYSYQGSIFFYCKVDGILILNNNITINSIGGEQKYGIVIRESAKNIYINNNIFSTNEDKGAFLSFRNDDIATDISNIYINENITNGGKYFMCFINNEQMNVNTIVAKNNNITLPNQTWVKSAVAAKNYEDNILNQITFLEGL